MPETSVLNNFKYKILTTTFRTNFGAIDIIAKHNDTIVFIEVKYRKSSYSGTPQEAVTAKNYKLCSSLYKTKQY